MIEDRSAAALGEARAFLLCPPGAGKVRIVALRPRGDGCLGADADSGTSVDLPRIVCRPPAWDAPDPFPSLTRRAETNPVPEPNGKRKTGNLARRTQRGDRVVAAGSGWRAARGCCTLGYWPRLAAWHGLPHPRPARGPRRGPRGQARRGQAASAARSVSAARQRDAQHRPADRRAVGRAPPATRRQDGAGAHLPAAQGARGREDSGRPAWS